MKQISYGGTTFNIDPDNYYNADYVQRYTNTISNYVLGSLMTFVGSVGSAVTWTPTIANYLGVGDIHGAQETIAGVMIVGFNSMATGSSIEAAEKLYDSYRFVYDYNVAAVGEIYNSFTDMLSAD